MTARPHDSELLLVLEGPASGTQYALAAETWLGRDPTCGVYLNTPRVSRRHAVLLAIGDGRYTISDAASRNGV